MYEYAEIAGLLAASLTEIKECQVLCKTSVSNI